MNRFVLSLALAALALAPLAGCTRLNYAAGPQKPVLANSGLVRPHQVTSQFLEKGRRVYLFWGLLPVAGYDGEDLIAARMNQGDGIINFTGREYYSFVDQLIGLLTVGIVSSRTVQVRGDVFTWAPPAATATPSTTVIVPPGNSTVVVPPSRGSIVVPPSSEGSIVVPPSGGTIVVPSPGRVVVP